MGLETDLPNSPRDNNVLNHSKGIVSQNTFPSKDRESPTCLRITFGTCLKADAQPLPLEALMYDLEVEPGNLY